VCKSDGETGTNIKRDSKTIDIRDIKIKRWKDKGKRRQLEGKTNIRRDKQMERQADEEANKWKDKQIGRQTDRETNIR
jgi:hypothetical protein